MLNRKNRYCHRPGKDAKNPTEHDLAKIIEMGIITVYCYVFQGK